MDLFFGVCVSKYLRLSNLKVISTETQRAIMVEGGWYREEIWVQIRTRRGKETWRNPALPGTCQCHATQLYKAQSSGISSYLELFITKNAMLKKQSTKRAKSDGLPPKKHLLFTLEIFDISLLHCA